MSPSRSRGRGLLEQLLLTAPLFRRAAAEKAPAECDPTEPAEADPPERRDAQDARTDAGDGRS